MRRRRHAAGGVDVGFAPQPRADLAAPTARPGRGLLSYDDIILYGCRARRRPRGHARQVARIPGRDVPCQLITAHADLDRVRIVEPGTVQRARDVLADIVGVFMVGLISI